MVTTTCLLPILQDMEDKKAFKGTVINGSFAIVFVIFATFGLFGYWCFGPKATPMIIRALPQSVFLKAIKVFMCVGIFCSYPLQLYPATEVADQWFLCGGNGTGTLGSSDEEEKEPLTGGEAEGEEGSDGKAAAAAAKPGPKLAFYFVRFATIWASAALAIFVPDFGFILALTGAMCSSVLGITYPVLAYIKLEPDGPLPQWKLVAYWLLAIGGLLAGIFCSVQIITGKAERV